MAAWPGYATPPRVPGSQAAARRAPHANAETRVRTVLRGDRSDRAAYAPSDAGRAHTGRRGQLLSGGSRRIARDGLATLFRRRPRRTAESADRPSRRVRLLRADRRLGVPHGSEGAAFSRVVLLGPSHFTHLHGVALPGAMAMRTPLGDVPRRGLPAAAQPARPLAGARPGGGTLPFLQATLRPFVLVPLAVGEAQPEEVGAVLERLWGGPETLIVVSSDLSHYLPYADAQRADAASAKEILALGQLRRGDACGAAPVNGLLAEARRRVLRAELVDLRNSGDTAGDKDRVVGYGAFAFYERPTRTLRAATVTRSTTAASSATSARASASCTRASAASASSARARATGSCSRPTGARAASASTRSRRSR